MNHYFAVTFRGLERVAATEIEQIRGCRVAEVAYRRVAFSFSGKPARLLSLRTVDDLFLTVGQWAEIGHTRSALDSLRRAATETDLQPAAALCGRLRYLPERPDVSLTVNFIGKRNYNTAEIKQALAAGFAHSHPWHFDRPDSEAQLNVRLFIEHQQALVGVRLAGSPLWRRPYRATTLPGALKPPVAAALVRLAGRPRTDLLLDPYCGSGTILAEASGLGWAVSGGDVDSQAVQTARQTMLACGATGPVARWDAAALPLPDASVDGLVSNLPWGHQVERPDSLPPLLAEIGRVVKPGGRVVLLTEQPQALAIPGFRRLEGFEISLAGKRPTVVVYG